MADISIRAMNNADPAYFAAEECAQGWQATPDKFITRLNDEREGRCRTFVAEWQGMAAGYVSLYYAAPGLFAGQNVPEIVDFGVLERYRRRGIGTQLMDAAEKAAAAISSRVCLAVGLHVGYGSAQRLYVKRGYVPDGSGVWYGDHVCEPYSTCANDDDLILYLSKELNV